MIMEEAVRSIPVGFQTLGPKRAAHLPRIAGRRKVSQFWKSTLDEKTVGCVRWTNRAEAYSILFTYHICNVRWEKDYQLYI
jgi:hypothetical protein